MKTKKTVMLFCFVVGFVLGYKWVFIQDTTMEAIRPYLNTPPAQWHEIWNDDGPEPPAMLGESPVNRPGETWPVPPILVDQNDDN